MWPGCTRSNTPWHMMTFLSRGRAPTAAHSSSTLLTLRRYPPATGCSITPLRSHQPYLAGPDDFEQGFCRLLDRGRIPQRGILPFVDLGHHARHPGLERDARLPFQIPGDLADIGEGFVRLAGTLGDVHH